MLKECKTLGFLKLILWAAILLGLVFTGAIAVEINKKGSPTKEAKRD